MKPAIILPVKDRPDLTGLCLDSLLVQDYDQSFRVIAVNNNSEPDTVFILERYKEIFDDYGTNYTLIHNPSSRIPRQHNYNNYRAGVVEALKDPEITHIVFCDNDMDHLKTWLRSGLALIDNIPDAAGVTVCNFYWHKFISGIGVCKGLEYGQKENMGGADMFMRAPDVKKVIDIMTVGNYPGWDWTFTNHLKVVSGRERLYSTVISLGQHNGTKSIVGNRFSDCLNWVKEGEPLKETKFRDAINETTSRGIAEKVRENRNVGDA